MADIKYSLSQYLEISNVRDVIGMLMQVLDAAYVVVALMCTFLGVTGYLMYGPNVLDVITFNLPQVLSSKLASYHSKKDSLSYTDNASSMFACLLIAAGLQANLHCYLTFFYHAPSWKIYCMRYNN